MTDEAEAALSDAEIDAIHDAAQAAAEQSWLGNIPPNPHPPGSEAAEVWQFAFRRAWSNLQ